MVITNMNIVEAIEDGKIVRVTEEYAKKEGLLIIRKQSSQSVNDHQSFSKPELAKKEAPEQRRARVRQSLNLDPLRKPLNYYKNNVVADLKENFQWEIVKMRKVRNMSRKQLAQAIGESEEAIKMVENGILPADDFVIVNKIEKIFNINLRRDGKTFNVPVINPIRVDKTESEGSAKGSLEVMGEIGDILDLEEQDSEKEE